VVDVEVEGDYTMSIKSKLAIAVASVAIVGAASVGAATFASAQVGGTTPQAQGAKQQAAGNFLNHVAANLGISVEELKAALKTGGEQTVDDLVAAGTITQEQGDKLKARIESGKGLGLLRGHRPGARLERLREGIIASAAQALRMDASALKTELKDGKSIADVAAEENVTVDAVKAQKLDAAVASGKITQSREDTALEGLADRLDTIVNRKRPSPDMMTPPAP
jgi:hypothetical protein